MEFDRNKTPRLQVFFYIVYVCAVIYLLLDNNPFLYSNKELRVSLAGEQIDGVSPIPKRVEVPTTSTAEVTFWSRFNPERNHQDLSGNSRDKDYIPSWYKTISEGIEASDLTGWAADTSGIYLTTKGPWALALNPDGHLKWKFRFTESLPEQGLLEPAMDEDFIYLSRPQGQFAALRKKDGHLQWKVELASEILSAPLLADQYVWLVIKPIDSEIKRLEEMVPQKGTRKKQAPPPYRFVKLHRQTGELVDYSQPLALNGPVFLTLARDQKSLIATNDNKIYFLNLEDGKTVTSNTVPDPIQGPAALAEGKVIVTLASGKVQAWDAVKRGKFEWEVDLESPLAGGATYIPLFQRLAVTAKDGHIHMIDLKKAERLWKFHPENRLALMQAWSTRLNTRLIEKLNMTWEKKGWSLWSACQDNKLCIYNPDRGQLLSRMSTPGTVVSPALFVGSSFYLLSFEGRDQKKRLILSHFLTEDQYKKSQKVAQDSSSH